MISTGYSAYLGTKRKQIRKLRYRETSTGFIDIPAFGGGHPARNEVSELRVTFLMESIP
jgi:hypothetical protein